MADFSALELHNVVKRLEETATFLQPYLQIANAHATDFIVKDFWNALLPVNIQKELLNMTETQLKQLASHGATTKGIDDQSSAETMQQKKNDGSYDVNSMQNNESHYHEQLSKSQSETNTTNSSQHQEAKHKVAGLNEKSRSETVTMNLSQHQDAKHKVVGLNEKTEFRNSECVTTLIVDWQHGSLGEFCRAAWRCCIDESDLIQTYEQTVIEENREVFVDTFMNEKKSHEIERMSMVCNKLVNQHNTDLVIDLGSGKGYLGSYLHLQYDIPVLGIDAISSNTKSAVRRTNILTKQWDGLTHRKQHEISQTRLTKKEKKLLKAKKLGNRDEDDKRNDISMNSSNIGYVPAKEQRDVTEDEDSVISKGNDNIQSDNTEDIRRDNSVKTKANGYVPVTVFIEKSTDLDEIVLQSFPDLCNEYTNLSSNCDRNPSNDVSNPAEITNSDNTCGTLLKTEQSNGCLNSQGINKGKFESENNSCSKGQPSSLKIGSQIAEITSTLQQQNINPDRMRKHCEKVSKQEQHCLKELGVTMGGHDIKDNTYSKTQDSSLTRDSQVEEMTGTLNERIDFNINQGQHVKPSMSEMCCLLTGLHTCGDLASSSLQLFVHSPMLKVLCTVGCCYHLLTEEFLETSHQNSDSCVNTPGFPLSSYLKKKQFKLGQTARNLASQSVGRLEHLQLQGKKFFPRALLEVILRKTEVEGSDRPVKGLRGLEQKCGSIQEFVTRACQRLDIQIQDGSIIERMIEKYADEEHKLAAFFQLRTVLAPCIESLIILDRVCYLLESGVKDVRMIKLFDPVISPRCYGILATKL